VGLLTTRLQNSISSKSFLSSLPKFQNASKRIYLAIMTKTFDRKKTALLLLDLQVGFLQRLPPDNSVIDNSASAISIARQHGAQIVFVRAALNEADIEAVPEHNFAFAAIKGSKEMTAAMHPDAPTTQIHPKLAPKDGDLVHRKVRFGTFMVDPSKSMLDEFAAKGIKTIIIGGVITSGAVLSAVRQLADLDFQLVVLEDCCADYDTELHNVLCEKVFPKQAKVIKSSELASMF
jgi:nicotinamidase-related amidase